MPPPSTVEGTSMKIRSAFFLALMLAVGRPASAATIYLEQWNTAGDAEGWTPNVLGAAVSVPGAGGNPGGYLDMTGNVTFPIIGGVADFPPVNGNYAAVNNVSFDLNLFSGVYTQEAFRVRYQDGSFNGWFHPVAYAGAQGGWQSFSIAFNPTWTDLQAIANGWVADGPLQAGVQVDFATTMSNVFRPEIRLSGIGNTFHAGLDNFELEGNVAAVPEPATLALLGSGLIGVRRFVRRKK
jgi:PEP-CTERM motif-containing protein